MSFPKELYFFNALGKPEHNYHRSQRLRWYLRHFHDNPVSYLSKMTLAMSSYGEMYRPKVRGEATASYAAMAPEVVREVVTLNPDIKVILMVRDPVARAWSHAKKDLVRDRNLNVQDVSYADFERFFRDPYQMACGNYTTMINNWSTALKSGNLLVGRFADIERKPAEMLHQVLAFLGVSEDPRYLTKYLNVRVNTTEDADIPDVLRASLRGIFVDEIDRLNAAGLL